MQVQWIGPVENLVRWIGPRRRNGPLASAPLALARYFWTIFYNSNIQNLKLELCNLPFVSRLPDPSEPLRTPPKPYQTWPNPNQAFSHPYQTLPNPL